MKTVEFNFNYAETHNGDKYFFICLPDDHSGRYVELEVAERLLAAAKEMVETLDSEGDAPLVINDQIDALKAAIKQAEEG